MRIIQEHGTYFQDQGHCVGGTATPVTRLNLLCLFWYVICHKVINIVCQTLQSCASKCTNKFRKHIVFTNLYKFT